MTIPSDTVTAMLILAIILLGLAPLIIIIFGEAGK